jgi:hypothetical protein
VRSPAARVHREIFAFVVAHTIRRKTRNMRYACLLPTTNHKNQNPNAALRSRYR